MKAYLLTASAPNVCKVEEIEVVKMTNTRVYLDNNHWRAIQSGYIFDTYIKYFCTKEEAYARAVELAERFLCVSRGDLAAAEQNLRTLLDEQLPNLFQSPNQ